MGYNYFENIIIHLHLLYTYLSILKNSIYKGLTNLVLDLYDNEGNVVSIIITVVCVILFLLTICIALRYL